MSGPDEINNENYKHCNENEINSPILLMSMNNLNTEINATHTHKKNQTFRLTDRTTQKSQ